ncbi:alpha-tocopherol transfer protein-like [Haemaphysalis longicornis]
MESKDSEEITETAALIGPPLSTLKKLIADEELFDCPKDEKFLLKFLRARKYEAEAAFRSIKNYFRARRDNPDIFDDFVPSAIPYDAVCRKNRLVTASTQRDALGRGVVLIKTGAWDGSICSVYEFISCCFMVVEWLLLHEDVQKRGVVYILDYQGLGLHHLTQFTPLLIRRLVHISEDCLPVRVKAVYVVNGPSVFDVIFAITKPFMKAKLVERVHLIGSNVEKLLNVVPSDVIPKEFEGTHESYDYDKLERDLLSRSEYFEELCRYGYGKESTHC